MKEQDTINGMSVRWVKQQIRRKMSTKFKPSSKVYDRKKFKIED